MKKNLLTLSAVSALALTTGCSLMNQNVITTKVNQPSKAFVNGKIYTQDASQPMAQAFLVKDGKFTFVGSNKDAKKYIDDNTKVIDLKEKTILPSFIDSHTHPGMVAVTSGNGELAKYSLPTTSKEDTYEYLRKIAKENPNLPFLIVGTW
ncbi:MAG: hypothetical protein KGV58_00380 [Campylobacteraceae bacterium]|nr:hypothetical protein [Campylobacteraceae bacterium]